MSESLANAAVKYFVNIDEAFKKYGTSVGDFGKTATESINNVSAKSKDATTEIKTMAAEMEKAFKKIAEEVGNW
jgi:hypothetical protein